MMGLALAVVLAAGAAAPAEAAGNVALEIRFHVADAGTRTLAQRRMVLTPGMAGRVRQPLEMSLVPGGPPLVAILDISTLPGPADDVVEITLASAVAEQGSEPRWERSRHATVRPGTSAILEAAPAGARHGALLISVTVRPAPGEPVNAPPVPVAFQLSIIGLLDDTTPLLQAPVLRTLSGQAVEYAFDYPIPVSEGGGSLSLQVEVEPGYPGPGGLPVRLALEASFPAGDGPARFSRGGERVLTPGTTWSEEMRPPGGGQGLRVDVLAVWRADRHPAPSPPL